MKVTVDKIELNDDGYSIHYLASPQEGIEVGADLYELPKEIETDLLKVFDNIQSHLQSEFDRLMNNAMPINKNKQ